MSLLTLVSCGSYGVKMFHLRATTQPRKEEECELLAEPVDNLHSAYGDILSYCERNHATL